jgi:tetratricopeptide (TPR) repeat protein
MIKTNYKSALLFAVLTCGVFTGTLKAQETLNDAITFTKNEQYDKAEELFKKLSVVTPANSKVFFYYGENTLQNYFADTISNPLSVAAKEAKDIFDKGVAANPAEPLNYVGLAKVATYLGDKAKAEELRVKAKSLLPPYKKVSKIANPKDYAFTLAKIAESYIRFDEVDTSKALPFIREALKIDSKNSDVYIIAGDIYILVNDGSKAIKNYNLAQDWDLKSPTANMKIGAIYVKGRNLQAAIPFFEQAISLDQNYAPAYRELGSLYSLAGKYDKSKEYFKTYLELTKGNIPAKIRYITSLFYAKEYKAVVTNVEEVLAVDNSRTYMNRIAGYSECELGNYDEALTYMDKLFASLPEDRLIKKDYTYLSRILLKKNQNYPKQVIETDKQEADLAKMQEKFATAPKGPAKDKMKADIDALTAQIAANRAQIAKADLEINRAFTAYDKAVTFDGGEDVRLENEKAMYENVYRRNVEAGNTWSRLLDKGRDSEADYVQAGKAYYTGKAFGKADTIFSKLVAKYPESLQGYLWLANNASAQDPDSKLGLAKPKFEDLLHKATVDSVKYKNELIDALRFLGYNSLTNGKYESTKAYYTRMLNVAPDDNEIKAKAFTSLAQMYFAMGEYPKAIEYSNKVLEINPNDDAAKGYIKYVNAVIAGAKPAADKNEISGVIKDASGIPIPGASVRVKDTACEAWTNAKGEYKFVMPESSATLVISASGYTTKEVPVTKARSYNATLNK